MKFFLKQTYKKDTYTYDRFWTGTFEEYVRFLLQIIRKSRCKA